MREGKNPVINQAQLIRSVADNVKQKLFTTASNRAQPSVHQPSQDLAFMQLKKRTKKPLLVKWMCLIKKKLNMKILVLKKKNEKFMRYLSSRHQGTHLAYNEFKASGWRSIPDQLYKLLVAVDTLSPSNVDTEQGFSALNNIITDIRNAITTNNAEKQLFGSSVRKIESRAIRKNLAWKRKKSSSLNKWHGSSKLKKE